MNQPPASSEDPGIRDSEPALRRAAQKARELGEQTRTPVYVLRHGQIVDLVAEDGEQPKRRQEGDDTIRTAPICPDGKP
ncbi:MAG: hypothetical protein ISR77_08495 [Pirellulaceae bacterium]|nr:hypothetical protein [Pirellulaceae bacterium]